MDRQIKKKTWTLKRIIGLSIAVAFVAFVIYSFIFGDNSSKLNVQAERLTVSEVQFGDFQEYIPVIGNVLPIITIYLDAIEGGRVEDRFILAGTMVEKGDKILQLGNTNLLLDIMWREAEFFSASNNLRTTRLQMEQNQLSLKSQLTELDYQLLKQKRLYERNVTLKDQKLISTQEYEQIKDEYDYLIKRKELAIETYKQDSLFRHEQIKQLEESLRRMESNLEIVKQKQESLTITAPIAGQLTSLNAEIGESKRPGERLGQIDVLDSFKVQAGIDEHYISRIELGRHGTFDLAGQTHQLVVSKIYPEVLDGRFNVDLHFIGDPPSGIRRGQTLHIRLELGDLTEATTLARGGFYQTTGGQWVYVLEGNDAIAVKRNIKLGRQNQQVFEVLDGLKPGEKVITSSYETFGDKDKLILK
ncbi:efflux RND transporter periplasmic adaptor subunit [candidate division KSB1 bacterium]|nr:efflux RND transporter periplasmic adaptor subunit [candidate division KSB1 bacterium]